MSSGNIQSLEREGFKRRLAALAKASDVSDADFADVVYTAVSRFGIEESAFRAAFGLSKGAVERWTMLKNMPQPVIRPRILEWLATQLNTVAE